MNQSICQVGMQEIASFVFIAPVVVLLWALAGGLVYSMFKARRDL